MTTFITQQAGNLDPVVARLGTIELRRSELIELVRAREQRSGEASVPDDVNYLLRAELATRAALVEALARGWGSRPDIAAEVERYRARLTVSRYLDSVTSPPPQYPTDGELKVAYDANKETLRVPRRFRVAQIYLSFVAEADTLEQNKFAKHMAELAAKARTKDVDFGDLARRHSEHQESAERGGEIGWVSEEVVVPEIRAALVALGVGEVSHPIRTSQGWHIVKLLEDQPSRPGSFDELRPILIRGLRLSRAQQNEREYLDSLMQRVKIVDAVRT